MPQMGSGIWSSCRPSPIPALLLGAPGLDARAAVAMLVFGDSMAKPPVVARTPPGLVARAVLLGAINARRVGGMRLVRGHVGAARVEEGARVLVDLPRDAALVP